MSIFLVLGIAADDVFVFNDAWKQSGYIAEFEGNEMKRMCFTFRRAFHAMFITSFTTSIAFIATGLSKIMPISTFGFFSSIIIPINFILTVTFYPAILILWERKINGKFCKCKYKDTKKKI